MRFIDSTIAFRGDATIGTAAKGATTTIDYLMSSSCLINGAELVYQNAEFGDFVAFQVIDLDNVLGAGTGYVVNEWVTKWYIDPAGSRWRVVSDAGGTIPAGLYLRLIYTSTGSTNDVPLAINYWFYTI